jgi:hypothetical protein
VKLKNNWIAYHMSADFLLSLSEVYTMYEEIPISTYKIVQTIGKMIAGGLNAGLFMLLNIDMLFWVNNAEICPIKRGIRMLIIKVLIFLFII